MADDSAITSPRRGASRRSARSDETLGANDDMRLTVSVPAGKFPVKVMGEVSEDPNGIRISVKKPRSSRRLDYILAKKDVKAYALGERGWVFTDSPLIFTSPYFDEKILVSERDGEKIIGETEGGKKVVILQPDTFCMIYEQD